MRNLISHTFKLGLAAATLSTVVGLGVAPAASADSSRPFHDEGHAVFVQTDNVAGNQIVAYDRANDGTLRLVGTYDTGGLGGVLAGSAVGHLASQGSLLLDKEHSLLYAVNAGSNTVSVFSVRGDVLRLRQLVNSDGTFPVSVAAHENFV